MNPDPRQFVFEVTPRCNEACPYCYNVWKHREYPSGELTVEEWEGIVLKLKREARPRLISISGGEPLLWPGTPELVRLIRASSIQANLLTNASLMSEELAKTLVEAGVSLFQVQLSAPDRALHGRLRGVDDFDHVVAGMANVYHAGGRMVAVFVATGLNIGLLRDTLEFAVALGCAGFMFNRINPACAEHIALLPTAEALKDALRFLDDFSRKHRFPIACSVPLPPCVVDMRTYPSLGHGFCPSGNADSYYTVDFRGGVRICNHSPTIMGSILEGDLAGMVRGPHAERFRTVMPRCAASCEHAAGCRGGCKASAQVCYGSLEDNDPFVEANKR